MTTTYLLKSGDTLSQIARSYNISLEQLLAINPQLENSEVIQPGQSIYVPSLPVVDPETFSPPDVDPSNYAVALTPDKIRWFEIAQREMAAGIKEIPGPRDNPRIVEYHQSTTLHATDDETAWCSAFVNWCIEQAGIKGTRSASSRSWLTWGQEISSPRLGCIVVCKGHVGFYYQEERGRILLLGGNQSNQVKISPYSKNKIISYRWPIEIPLTTVL
jgi:uncharacterized protein (TIGR02594 family)